MFRVRHGTAETVQNIFHGLRMTCTTNKCWEKLRNLAMEDGGWGVVPKLDLYI